MIEFVLTGTKTKILRSSKLEECYRKLCHEANTNLCDSGYKVVKCVQNNKEAFPTQQGNKSQPSNQRKVFSVSIY